MLKTFDQVSEMIGEGGGDYLHISGSEKLLLKLPKGNWVGGSIEYFMTGSGDVVTDDMLYVTKLPSRQCRISVYDCNTISNITADAFANGFTIIILPFDSEVLSVYAKNAPSYNEIFLKNIIGWVSGFNLNKESQRAVVVNGQTGGIFYDKAVAVHVTLPEDLIASIGIVNIFTPDPNSPVIEFTEDSFYPERCLVNGKEMLLLDFINENNVDTRLPIIGDYSGADVNTTIHSVDDGVVRFGSPVFKGIRYRLANKLEDYSAEFRRSLEPLRNVDVLFSCNCTFNFLYGKLEGNKLAGFPGPMTFGEVAYQLLNQTLVYLTVVKA